MARSIPSAAGDASTGAAITKSELEAAIRQRPAEVDAALQEVSPVGLRMGLHELAPGLGVPLVGDPPVFDCARLAERLIAYLGMVRLLGEFAGLLADGSGLVVTKKQLDNMQMDEAVGLRLFSRTAKARCAIFRGPQFFGSGCLVGPSLVLTCAHVLDQAKQSAGTAPVEVQLANGARIGIDPAPVIYSPPSEADTRLPFSQQDEDYLTGNDMALLRLRVPAGASAAVVDLPDDDWEPTSEAVITLLHLPEGRNVRGYGFGTLSSFANPSKRWGYLSNARPGSSGGACFNVSGQLVGVHQGKTQQSGKQSRFIPLRLIRAELGDAVQSDLWPDYLWSLDGRLNGTLVVGRSDLFECFALLSKPEAKHRLLRIKRLDPNQGLAGLGYSVRLVRELVERLPAGNRVLVLSWPQVLYDDFDAIRKLADTAAAEKLASPDAAADLPGARVGETGTPTVFRGRAERLLTQISGAAARAGEIIWIVIEHANVHLGAQTLALETLASVAGKSANLRVVMIGNEAVSLPDPESRISDLAHSDLQGISLVEYLGPFDDLAVRGFIDRLHQALYGEPPLDKQLGSWSRNIVRELEPVNNRYRLEDMPRVTAKLRAMFAPMMVDGQVPFE